MKHSAMTTLGALLSGFFEGLGWVLGAVIVLGAIFYFVPDAGEAVRNCIDVLLGLASNA